MFDLRLSMWRWTAVLLLLFSFTVESAVPASPRELIMEKSEQLVTGIKENLGENGDYFTAARKLAEEILLPMVDFPRISKKVLGRHWAGATPDQRQDFNREFRDFLAHVFVTAMVNYADEIVSHAQDVSYPPVHLSPGMQQATVRMRVRLKSGLKPTVRYRMHIEDGKWMIHDLSIAGISFSSTYRSSFHREIVRHGLDGLITQIKERNRNSKSPVGSK
ncbi:MAG: ABC transporter substrate-binding protein [Gammaproteobacteria bacterium]|nr:ABC transporter substrate-binding protein [Gammaproteobacteria bacterium]